MTSSVYKILDEDNHATGRQQFEQQYTNVEIKTGPLTREDFSNAKMACFLNWIWGEVLGAVLRKALLQSVRYC